MTARAPRTRHIAAAVSPSMPAPRIKHHGPGNVAGSPNGGGDRGCRAVRRTGDLVRKTGGNLDDGGPTREVAMGRESAAQRMLVTHLLVPVLEQVLTFLRQLMRTEKAAPTSSRLPTR